jgi:hypothetical protein
VPDETQSFGEWCMVELYGHIKYFAYVSEMTLAGESFIRADIPGTNGKAPSSEIIGRNAIYRLHPTNKDTALRGAERLDYHSPIAYVVPSPAGPPQTSRFAQLEIDRPRDVGPDDDN